MKKLNLLLVMPRVVQAIGDGYPFPLGIAYVSSSLKSLGFNTFTLNLNHMPGNVYDILEQAIVSNKIDVVGTGGLSFQYPTIYDIVRYTKKINSNIVTIVGGGIITAEPEIALKALEYADIGVIGEGEITICKIVHALENNEYLSDVQGIIYKDKDNYYTTKPRKEIMDLGILPSPDYEGFGLETYLELPSPSVNNLITRRMVYISGSRSCPYQCTFCFHSAGKIYRQRSIDDVIEEIIFLKKKYKIISVCMTDELFARKRERIEKFHEEMKKLDIIWFASFRADDIDQDLIDMLRGGTCAGMAFGIESADNLILKSMKKRITFEQIERTLEIVYDSGVPLAGNFIFGDIEETYKTAKKTINWWTKNTKYNLGLNLIIPYPGSYIYKYACNNNIITDRIKYLKDGCPQINISRMNDSEFGLIAKEIFEAPFRYGNQVSNIETYEVTEWGRVTISGKCSSCETKNTWGNVKLFVGNNWLPCSDCGQKHYAPLSSVIQERISSNLLAIMERHTSVALWGVTYYSLSLFNENSIYMDPNVLIVDNAHAKQLININGKKVYPPSIIGEQEVPVVIVFYPNSILQLSSLIRESYPHVKEVFDICDLTSQVGTT